MALNAQNNFEDVLKYIFRKSEFFFPVYLALFSGKVELDKHVRPLFVVFQLLAQLFHVVVLSVWKEF